MNEIEIEEDIEHLKLSWKIKKIGFVVIFILVLLSVLGLFGTGLLSTSEVGNKNFSWLNYEKFTRAGSPSGITLNFINREDSVLSFSVNNTFLENIQIDRIMPLPVDEIASSQKTDFFFKITPGAKKVLIKFNYTSDKPGVFYASINYKEDRFTFNQFIYP